MNLDSTILALLGVTHAGNHLPCRFCGNRDSLSVQQGADGGWFFKCHRCGEKGNTATALALVEGLSYRDALKRLGEGSSFGGPWRKSYSKPEPVLPLADREASFALRQQALETVLSGKADWALKERFGDPERARDWIGRSPLLGFVEEAKVPGKNGPWVLRQAWIINVYEADGTLRAIKAHRQKPRPSENKTLWLPFGTVPTERPRHGYSTLWPCPEWSNGQITITEGELKAAAFQVAGFNATAPTSGADFQWNSKQASRFAGRDVLIVPDDDEAGWRFSANTQAALCGVAASIRIRTIGKESGK